jgi:hypothetical protein
LFLPAKPSAIDTNKLVFFHQKVNGIGQRDTCIDMFLYNGFIPERRVVQGQAVVLFQQACQ